MRMGSCPVVILCKVNFLSDYARLSSEVLQRVKIVDPARVVTIRSSFISLRKHAVAHFRIKREMLHML